MSATVGQLEFSENNWARVEESARKRCVKALKNYIESELPEHVGTWREEYLEGQPFSVSHNQGAEFRAVLRTELAENNLPWVEYPGGKRYRIWEDFYWGAFREALGLDRA